MRPFFLFIVAALWLLKPAVGLAQNTVYTLADTAKANQLLVEANTFSYNNKCDSSLACIMQAREILVYLHKDTCRQLAYSWRELAWCYYELKQYDTAIIVNQKALDIQLSLFEPTHKELTFTYTVFGRLYRDKGDYSIAINWFSKALLNNWYNNSSDRDMDISLGAIIGCFNTDKSNKGKIKSYDHEDTKRLYTFLTNFILNLSKRADYERPKTVYLLGYTAKFDTSGLYENKIHYLNEAISMQNHFSVDVNKDTVLMQLYDDLGDALSTNSKETESFYCFEKCLNIAKNVFGEKHYKTAKFYNQLGIYYAMFSIFDKAISYFDTSLSIKIANFGFISREVSETYNDMASCYRKMSEYEKSIIYAKTCLDICKKSKRDNLDSYYVVSASWNLGYAYESNRDYKTAIDHYTYCLNAQTEFLFSRTLILSTLGTSNFHLQNYSKAIEFLKLSHEAHIQKAAKGNLVSENTADLVTLFFLARSYAMIGNKQEVQNITNEIEKYLNKSVDLDSFFIQLLKGRTNIIKGDYLIAVKDFKQGISLLDTTGTQPLLFQNILFYLAVANKELYKKSDDKTYLYSSHKVITELLLSVNNTINKRLTYTDTRSNLFISNNSILEEAIAINDFLNQKSDSTHYVKEAFNYFELSKAFELNTLLRKNNNNRWLNIPSNILEKQKELILKITFTEKRHQELLKQKGDEIDSLRILNDRTLYELQKEYDIFKKSLEKNYPKYYRLKYDRTTVNLSYVQDTLLKGTDKSMLSYFVGDTSIYAFVVNKDKYFLQEIKKDSLTEWVTQMSEGIYGYYGSDMILPESFKRMTVDKYVNAAALLYQKLIAPVKAYLTGNVIVIPDGVLGYLPFDALLTEKPDDVDVKAYRFGSFKYWGDNTVISYAYSATSLKEMVEKQHQTPPQYNGVLALAPFYNGKSATELQNERQRSMGENLEQLKSLPNSGNEADTIAQITDGRTLTGINANRAALEKYISQYRMIHFATHAQADDRLGDYAYLALSVPNDTTKFEKFYVKDIYNLTLNADLVTLSACETGIGELRRGEGIISIARAFAYAGAPCLVTSLWRVDDGATAELMTSFYTHLKSGEPIDKALQSAKLEIKEGEDIRKRHPYFWSGFLPIGDMRAVYKKTNAFSDR